MNAGSATAGVRLRSGILGLFGAVTVAVVAAVGWIAGSGDTVSAQSGAVRDCHFTLFGDRYWTECAACHSRARRYALLRSANVIRSATASRAVTARSRSSPVNREAARFNHV